MKKIYFTIALTIITLFANAQYTKIYDFPSDLSLYYYNSLYSDGTFLYGMTTGGGTNSVGVIFKIKPDGSNYTKLHDFSSPNGSLSMGGAFISDGIFLYGMTYGGGTNGDGVIFKIKPDGSNYTKLLDFASTAKGKSPYGALISIGTFLYGMTNEGGTNNSGVLFKIMTDGSGYTKLLDFAGAANGANPGGSLIYDGTYLYGMTFSGGANSAGVIFKIKPDGSNYTKLLDFDNFTNGANPQGSLIYDGIFLYGMTANGGTNGDGVIFKIKPNGTNYNKLLDFEGATKGRNPYGTLISDGTFLYGITPYSIMNGQGGVIFKIKPDGSSFTKLRDFAISPSADGLTPAGSLIFDGSLLYGMTKDGGTNGVGVLFRYDPLAISVSTAMLGNPYCYNQCVNSANTSALSGKPPYSYSWSTTPVQNTATVENLCPGTYTVTVTDSIGVTVEDSITISPFPLSNPSICMVTVDDSSKHNIIYWDKTTYTSADSFIVYRETLSNTYKRIAAVPKDSMSLFVDTVSQLYFPFTGNPNSGTYRYKLQIRDTCGNYSPLSLYHNTIYVTQTGGTFNWNGYQIEGEASPIPQLTAYYLWRDDNSTGNWAVINGVSGSQLTITDPNFATYPNARWRIETVWTISCTPTRAITTARSNIKGNMLTTGMSAANELYNGVSIYPNPATNKTTLTINSNVSKNVSVELLDILGNAVMKESKGIIVGENKIEVNLSELSGGIYFLRVENSIQKIQVIK